MITKFVRSALFGAGLVSTVAFGGNGHRYLGGAFDINHCSALAGANRCQLAVYGPGFDDAGVYYPFFNACFGSQCGGGGGGGGGGGSGLQSYFFKVDIEHNADIEDCIDTMERVGERYRLRCVYIDGIRVQCTSGKTLTKDAANDLSWDLTRLECVDWSYTPSPTRNAEYRLMNHISSEN